MDNSELGKMSDHVLIRDFHKSDLSDLLDLFPKCITREFEISGFDPDHITEMVNRAFGRTGRLILGLLRLSGKEPIKFLVAEADGKIVGTTIVNDRGKFGYISSVMVHPEYRRKGIATRLMTNALNYLRRRRKARAVLHVMSENTPAISVYVKLGFKAFERSAYFVRDVDSIQVPEPTSGVKIREFQKDDLDEVYRLVRESEDPNHLRIFDFSKKNLKTPLLQRIFRFATQKKLVASFGGRIFGYVEAAYTTPKESGGISSLSVTGEDKSLGVERLLVEAASNEIVKGGVRRVRIAVPEARRERVETLRSLGFREVLTMDAMATEF